MRPSASLVTLVNQWRNTPVNTTESNQLLDFVCSKIADETKSREALLDVAAYYRWPVTKIDPFKLRERIISSEAKIKQCLSSVTNFSQHVIFKKLEKLANSMGSKGIKGLARMRGSAGFSVSDALRPG